jgi:phosphate transport system substrate-binding protein
MEDRIMRHARLSLIIIICLVLVYGPAAAVEPLIASGCSVSNFGYLNDLAGEFEKETGIKVLVRGGGSLVGLNDLGDQKTDFAASCKKKGPADPADFQFIQVAWDALVFIVNKDNPVSNARPEDIKAIYEGKITNWKQLGGKDMALKSFISTTKGMGGIGEALSKYILHGRPVTESSNSSMQASSAAIWEQLVERMPEGFASSGFASARKRKVKMLTINGNAPTKQNIMSGKYPFKRPLFIVVKKDARPEVKRFAEFALSKKGQRLISSYGIPSLSDMK